MTENVLTGAYFFCKENSEIIMSSFLGYFLTKNRHRWEHFQSYPSEVLLDCLARLICSSGTSFESLERISAPEKQISIGWKLLSSSVAFSGFKKVKIATFYSYFCFEGRFQAIFAKIHQKNGLRSSSSVWHPLHSENIKAKSRIFQKITLKNSLWYIPY